MEFTVNPPVEQSLSDYVMSFFSRNPKATRENREPGITVASPAREGIMIVRAPLMGLAFQGEAESALNQSQCGAAKRPAARPQAPGR